MRGRPTRAAHESPAGWGSWVSAQGLNERRPANTRGARESSGLEVVGERSRGERSPANTRGAREFDGLGVVGERSRGECGRPARGARGGRAAWESQPPLTLVHVGRSAVNDVGVTGTFVKVVVSIIVLNGRACT